MALKFLYSPSAPPLAALAAAAVANIDFSPSPDTESPSPPKLVFQNGEELVGAATLLRYFGRAGATNGKRGFYGADAFVAGQVDEWIDYAPVLTIGAEFERACAYIDSYLSLRTFLAGYDFSIADIAIWTGLAGAGPRWESIRKSSSPKYPALVRWFNTLMTTSPALASTIATYSPSKKGGALSPATRSLPAAAGKGKGSGSHAGTGESAERGEGPAELDLPGAEDGMVVTRFPPEPSGFLHIGHAKAALMNRYFADRYHGKMIIRFDDTNPSKEKDEFVQSILADLATLGVTGDRLTYTSDYFEDLQKMAERLIREGKAYVDDTPVDRMREERMEGIDSKNRNNTPEQSLLLWEEMKQGSPRGLMCCLRGKLDMQALNKALRDPVYYRCNPTPHHRVGSRYKIYPTYDFACPFVDALEGVTHALRSSEYHDRNDQYYRVLQDMGLRKVHVWDFSRLNFQYTLLSKRKLQWFVENGRVQGWDDPRFPTVQGIIRRGLTVPTLRQFILLQGASKNLNLMEWDKLWTMNKKAIDPVCPRHTAIALAGRVLLELRDGPATPFVRILPRHKKYAPAGKKATTFSRRVWLEQGDAAVVEEGEEVTLMDWGNAVVETIERDLEGQVTALKGHLHLDGSVKNTRLKLTWLPEIEELVALSLVEVDHLITKKKLEEDDDFTKVLNPRTWWSTPAVGDANMRNIQKGEILQLERKGYFICDSPYLRSSKPLVLISIPDGRQRPPPTPTSSEGSTSN